MNERIRELVGRAEAYAYEHEEHWHDGPDWQELFNKKFALLIVQECISELEKIKRSGVPTPIQGGLNLGVVSLKEHFGVE